MRGQNRHLALGKVAVLKGMRKVTNICINSLRATVFCLFKSVHYNSRKLILALLR